jgi:hypothetical protein
VSSSPIRMSLSPANVAGIEVMMGFAQREAAGQWSLPR